MLADGQIAIASAQGNEDLFWGIRGGDGNFRIVTEFKYRLHPLGPIVLAGLAIWPIARGAHVNASLARLRGRLSRRALDGMRNSHGTP